MASKYTCPKCGKRFKEPVVLFPGEDHRMRRRRMAVRWIKPGLGLAFIIGLWLWAFLGWWVRDYR